MLEQRARFFNFFQLMPMSALDSCIIKDFLPAQTSANASENHATTRASRQPVGGNTAPLTPSLPASKTKKKQITPISFVWRCPTAFWAVSITVVVSSLTVTQHLLSVTDNSDQEVEEVLLLFQTALFFVSFYFCPRHKVFHWSAQSLVSANLSVG